MIRIQAVSLKACGFSRLFTFLEKIGICCFGESFFTERTKRKAAERRISSEMRIRSEKILQLYGNSILRLAYSYFYNMSDAEDILQETLIRYMQAEIIFSDQIKEKAWLLKVAANLSKNRLRYNRNHATDELEETLKMENREDLSFVKESVQMLSKRQREVVHLFYYEDYSTKEISMILRRKESTVRSDLYRGRQKLKEILKGEYDFEI